MAIFESRLSKTMADLVSLQGGIPFLAPSMKEVPLENNPAAFRFAEKLLKQEIDVLILLTGVGTRTLVSVLETRTPKQEIVEALKKIQIVPRGPKPIKALNELSVSYALAVPEPNTWRELLKTLDGNRDKVAVKDRVVAVQEYGISNPELVAGLEARGAKVLRVPVYRWALPDDIGPLKAVIQKIVDGKMDVALFTTAVQIDHVFQVARQMCLEVPLKEAFGRVVVASVGPDTSEAIRSCGIAVDIQPVTPKMGPLVVETAERARAVLESKRHPERSEACLPDRQGSQHRDSSAPQSAAPQNDGDSVFLKACRREKTSFTPVWLMRQAGRYMKDYRLIRDRVSFLEICRNKDLAAEITVKAQEKIGADAAIIFSDILLIVEAFGLGLEFTKGDGPSIQRTIRNAKDVEAVPEINPAESLGYVFQAIRQARKTLRPDIPLIGFAGAPFTLASYMIEGGASKDFARTKNLMASDENLWKLLMQKIVRASIKYLNGQAEAGAQAVQIFDSWVGCLTAAQYEKYALPYSKELIREIRAGTPVIYFGTGTGPFLEKFSEAGASVIGVDHKVELGAAWRRIGYDKAIQGNLDPSVLLKPVDEITEAVKKILGYAAGRAGHIFNLGHGVLPETPLENVIALVDRVHELSRKNSGKQVK